MQGARGAADAPAAAGECLDDLAALAFVGRAREAADAGVLAHIEACAACRILVGEAASGLTSEPSATLPALPDLLRPDDRLSQRYQIARFVARGGMSEVYEARDERTNKRVAIKVLTSWDLDAEPRVRAELMREAALLAELEHPGIVRYLDYGLGPVGMPFIVTEWLQGETLAARLARSGPLTVAEVITLLRHVAPALAAAHRRGVVHRDLKPANLFLCAGELARAKLLDFGLAIRTSTPQAMRGVAGTPPYMSPEQARGARVLDARSDLFSLGTLAYECLTGRSPFAANSRHGVLAKVCVAMPARLRDLRPDVPDGLQAIFDRMLAKEPRERFTDAATLEIALAQLPLGASAASTATRSDALSTQERRVTAIVLARGPSSAGPSVATLEREIELLGGRVHALVDGWWVVSIVERAELDVEPVTLAARAATLLVSRAPELAAAIALGRAVTSAGLPLGPVVDQGMTLAAAARPGEIRIDDDAAALLRGRFSVGRDDRGHQLQAPAPDEVGEISTSDSAWRASTVLVTMRDDSADDVTAARRAFERHGGSLERCGPNQFAVSIVVRDALVEQAVRAARAALACKQAVPSAALALLTSSVPAGDARPSRPGHIEIDPATAALLAARFELDVQRDRSFLLFEKGLREPPRTVLGRQVPCVGREDELAALAAGWREATRQSQARAVVITGPAGAGKSRVRHELVERITGQGGAFELLIAAGDELRQGGAFAMVGQALRLAANVSGAEPMDLQRQRLKAHVARRLPAPDAARVSAFIGELAGIPFPDEAYGALASARRDAGLLADQTLRAWLDFLAAEAAHQPVLLVLEDLHWADSSSVRLVDAALKHLHDRPLFVAAFARPEVEGRFPGLWQEHRCTRHLLPPLTGQACEDIARAVVDGIDDAEAARVASRAGGNPFFLEELLRASVETNDLDALPATIVGVVQARFGALTSTTKRVLRAASVYGEKFRREALGPLLGGLSAAAIDASIAELERRDLVTAGEAGALAFRHALVQAAAYDTLTEADRAFGHRSAGLWLEQAGESDAMLLVNHFERAGLLDKAAPWCGAAAEQALRANDLPAVLDRVQRGVANGAGGEDLARMHVAAAEAHMHLGHAHAGEAAARAGLSATDPRTRARAIVALVQCLGLRCEMAEFTDWPSFSRRMDLDGLQRADRRAWQWCVLQVVDVFLAAGSDRASLEALLESVGDDASLGDPLLVARKAEMASFFEMFKFDRGLSVAKLEEIERAYAAADDERAVCRTLLNIGVVLADAGLLARAAASLRRARQIASTLGLRFVEASAAAGLALVHLERGDLDGAIVDATDAARLARILSSPRIEGFSLYLQARACCEQGRFAEAHAHAGAACELLAAFATLLPAAQAMVARAQLRLGAVDDALVTANRAAEALARAAGVEDGEALVLLVQIECLVASNQTARAREAIAHAKQRLRERAAMLADEENRASFLYNLLEHRRTMALDEP